MTIRKFFYVLLAIFCLPFTTAYTQNYAVYNHYFVNPFLYNPAEAATDYTYLFVNHRQQWMKVEGAPTISTVSLNTLIDGTRAGIGFKASAYKRGLLNTTDFSLTYAYGIPVSKNGKLFFGISGGAISNTIDIEKANPDDPAITNYLSNNFQPSSSFGMVLHTTTGLNIGIAMPQLFIPRFNSASSFEHTKVSPFDNIVLSTYFRRKVEGKIVSKNRKGVRTKVRTKESDAPLELYALYKYSKFGTSQFEIMGKLNISQSTWLGAGYRQAYGFVGSVGFNLQKFLLSYSYEPGSQPQPQFSSGSHEVQLGIRLGDVKKFKGPSPVLRSTLKPTVQNQHNARFKYENADDDEGHDNPNAPKRVHYVVVKTFNDFTLADQYKRELIGQKFNADVYYSEKERRFHVHVFSSQKSGEAHEEARNLRMYSKLKTARVLTVTMEKK